MKYAEFTIMKLYDVCVIKVGVDAGTKCRVVYIDEGGSVLVEALDEKFRDRNSKLKLINYRYLDYC